VNFCLDDSVLTCIFINSEGVNLKFSNINFGLYRRTQNPVSEVNSRGEPEKDLVRGATARMDRYPAKGLKVCYSCCSRKGYFIVNLKA
jgi:hypothetical protein